MDGVSTGVLGEVLIRCNNVLYIRQMKSTMNDDDEDDQNDDEDTMNE